MINPLRTFLNRDKVTTLADILGAILISTGIGIIAGLGAALIVSGILILAFSYLVAA